MSEEFIRDVDEELRDQELKNMWKKYGKYVIGAIIGIVVAVGGKGIYTSVHEGNLNEQSSNFAIVLKKQDSSKSLEAIDVLKTLSTSGVEGYEIHAAFRAAKIHANAGDIKSAVATLDAFAKDSSVPLIYRDLAKLQAVMLGFDDASAEQNIQKLKEVALSNSEYQYLASEMLAMAYLSNKNNAKAYEIYLNLSRNMDAPAEIKGRAGQMATMLK